MRFSFGFTGTPIDKKTLNTHRNFGQEGERYLDYYSIQQAIDDGADSCQSPTKPDYPSFLLMKKK